MSFNPSMHAYTANGVVIPSVTKVTGVVDKPALVPWAVKETVAYIKRKWKPGEEYTGPYIHNTLLDAKRARFAVSEKAMGIGTAAHNWIEAYINAQLIDPPERVVFDGIPNDLPKADQKKVKNATDSYLEWEHSQKYLRYIASERKLFSKKYMYSGTVDIIYQQGNKLVVADLKTSKAIYQDYLIQCSAYAAALEEEDGVKVDEICIIRIPKDGKPVEVLIQPNTPELFGIFRACLAIWRWKNDWNPNDARWRKNITG